MTDEHLDGLSKVVHEALKRLKMGDSASIPCSKDYKGDEVLLYARAYAYHKHKWFEVAFDKTANVVRATRTPIPPDDFERKIDEEEVS
jgi:hypothetical protein